jgi:hypothetical protein
MKYCAGGNLSGSAPEVWNFRCNGAFDPDQTATGHQPYGWDQWTAFYTEYVVSGARLKAVFTQGSSSGSEPTVVGVTVSSVVTNPADIDLACERPATQWQLLATDWDNSASQQTVYADFDAHRTFGVVNVRDNTDRFGAPVTATPAEQAYFQLFVGAFNGSGTHDVSFRVEIEYDIIFSLPKGLAKS